MYASIPTGSPAAQSPMTALQRQFGRKRSIERFDTALRGWSLHDPALADVTSHQQLTEILETRDYARHDEVLFTLLRRAATLGAEGALASEIVLNAMLPAVPGIVCRVLRVCRAAVGTFGARRGVTGGGVSATEDSVDVQAAVIGHLWEQIRCYPLQRRHHVAANLMRDTQRCSLRALGVDTAQTAANVISIDDAVAGLLPQPPGVESASVELLELLSWAAEQHWLDDEAAAILTARYYGEHVGRDGVATDRQLGALLGVSQPTATRHRLRAVEALAAAAQEFPGMGYAAAG